MRIRLLAALAASFVSPALGLGLTIVHEDPGLSGRDDLLALMCAQADQDAREGLRVTVAGACGSSCALCRPRNPNFCSAPNTELWLRASPVGGGVDAVVMAGLPPLMRMWIESRRERMPMLSSLMGTDWMVLKGEELRQIVPPCREWLSNTRTGFQTPVSVPAVVESGRRRKALEDAGRAQDQMRAVQPVMPPSGSWPRR